MVGYKKYSSQVEFIKKKIEEANKSMDNKYLTESERLRAKHPALQEAWEQISVIRELVDSSGDQQHMEKWMKRYMEVQAMTGQDMDPRLADAWEKYYTIKALYSGNT